jgi:hypothetical protein
MYTILTLSLVLVEALLALGIQIKKLLVQPIRELLLHLLQCVLQSWIHSSLAALEMGEVVVGEIQNRSESDTRIVSS